MHVEPGRVLLRHTLAMCAGLILGVSVIWALAQIAPKAPVVPSTIEPHIAAVMHVNRAPQFHGQSTALIEPAKLLFVGDIMLDRNVAARSQAAHDLTYPFQKLPPNWFNQFDLAIANLEGPVTDQRRPPEKTIDFLFATTTPTLLKAQGIDAVSQANNHSYDQGRIGSDDSRKRLLDAGLVVFGNELNDMSISMATTTVQGQTIALIGWNTTSLPLDRAAAAKVIDQAHQVASTTIVFMHWGIEYKDEPLPAVRDLAHWFIDHGIDIVIGGHPHWVQGIESYKNHPIIYSLGNFIFDQDFSDETRHGLAVGLTIHDDGSIDLQPIPLQIDISQPRVVAGDELKMRLDALAKISDQNLKQQIETGLVEFGQK